ncbi:MAG: UDP-forming cellulose synthase catalytic subunit [Acidobacteria bacterium]|nr:UDP-forming cellulose synthase catalytic subunit [Acidobacteriota bacterium]
MNRAYSPPRERSLVAVLFLGLLACAGTALLGVLLILPLPWKEQAILGAGVIALAFLLNVLSRSALITMALITISVFSTFRYAYWRVTQTWYGIQSAGHLHQWDTLVVVLLLLAEFYAFTTLVLGYFQTLRPLKRRPLPLAGGQQDWPTVDVLIPTYNESLEVVRSTVVGALAMEYPGSKMKVFVLDDGRREEFRDFAARVGAGYITRADNSHAKAGNINHALGLTDGEYVAIFDSDHVPTRAFLETTLGWFQRDRRLGMVQTPHHFYSPDPFERNLGQFRKIPNEGELFHRLVQDGNDLWNASFFCGSCAVLRRQALREIGGIAVETVTEDAHTALRMQRRGWTTAYINIPLAAGLATESLAAHIGQRIRWARGMVQILRTENPLFASGLSLPQRVCYFNATTHFLFAVPRLIFLVMPLVYLFFGMVNIYGYSLAVFAYALPHIVLSNLTNSRIQGRHRFSFWNEIYEAVLAPYILFPTLLALINPRLGKFNVTAKGGVIRHSYFDRRIAWPFLVLLALNVLGLVMAGRRFSTDPAHHDTVLMNTVWTVYNAVILSVAASVAWERKQRRSQVRVNLRTPVMLIAPNGRQFRGETAQLSCRGAMVRIARSREFSRGSPVTVVIGDGNSECQIAARVAHSSRRFQHLYFPALSLSQEAFLVSLVYSRPGAWVTWHQSHRVDRPLLSLAHIVWLAFRGVFLILAGFFTSRPRTRASVPRAERAKRSAPVVTASLLMCALALASTRTSAQGPPAGAARPPAAKASAPPVQPQAGSTTQPAVFHEQYELRSLAPPPLTLTGAGASENFFFGTPLTKIVSTASLDLVYSAPLVRANEAWLRLWLNGTPVGSIPLAPGLEETEVILPTDLLTTDNALTLQLQGHCAACRPRSAPWVTIGGTSQLRLGGTRLSLPNDLALLPVPFFDSAGQHAWSLPVVFTERPDMTTLEAAAIVSSWFGVASDFRGVSFPVNIGGLPSGNAVVLALRGSPLAAGLSLPTQPGPLIAVRDNPNDPYGKLLIVAGEKTADLLAAARALVTRNNAARHADAARVNGQALDRRREYEAPRWLKTDRPVPLGAYTTEERLKVRGSGSINIYFRLPPDLFLPAVDSVPLLLKFSYTGVAANSKAALHLRLNDRNVDSIRLAPAASPAEQTEIVRLPTGRLEPYTNRLTIDVDFPRAADTSAVSEQLAIHRDSTIDLSALPHSVVLPRLELFAGSGYPFTAWPDLGRTAVILSQAPTADEYETLLDMAGFCGAETGAPVTNVKVTDASNLDEAWDKDIFLLGTPATQPLLREWSGEMPLALSSTGMQPAGMELPSRLVHPEWPFRLRDRDRLGMLLAKSPPFDLVVEDFVSPLRPDRSVIALVPAGSSSREAIRAMFTPNLDKGPIYGGLALAENAHFQSFLLGSFAYHFGRLDRFQQARVFLIEHYVFIPLVVAFLAFVVAGWLYQGTERAAARRLAARQI